MLLPYRMPEPPLFVSRLATFRLYLGLPRPFHPLPPRFIHRVPRFHGWTPPLRFVLVRHGREISTHGQFGLARSQSVKFEINLNITEAPSDDVSFLCTDFASSARPSCEQIVRVNWCKFLLLWVNWNSGYLAARKSDRPGNRWKSFTRCFLNSILMNWMLK